MFIEALVTYESELGPGVDMVGGASFCRKFWPYFGIKGGRCQEIMTGKIATLF